MHTSIRSIAALVALSIASILPVSAVEDHGHSHEKAEAGPNGGRILTKVEPHAEFLVTGERKIQITFLDEKGKAITPANQVIVVTAGERANPTKLTMVKTGEVFLSDKALPEGNDFPTVVQIKLTPESKSVVEKFNLNLTKCPTCKYSEYACVCEH